MKTLYLTFNMLRTLLRRNTFMCVLLCIGAAACNLMFIYTFGLVASSNISDSIPDYFLSYESGDILSVNEINSKLRELKNTDIYYYTAVDSSRSDEIFSVEGLGVDGYMICGSDAVVSKKVSTGVAKDAEKIGTVIVPVDFASVSVGDTITLNGCELLVVGSAVSKYYYVSDETFEICEFVPYGVAVDVPYRDIEAAEEYIKEAFPEGYVVDKTETTTDRQDMKDYAITFMIFLLSLISFIYMFVYISEENAREYAIYQLVGGEQKTIVLTQSMSIFVVLLISVGLSLVAHVAFYDSFFSKLLQNDEFYYKISDYALISAVSAIVVYMILTVYINVKMRGSTLESIRRTLK